MTRLELFAVFGGTVVAGGALYVLWCLWKEHPE